MVYMNQAQFMRMYNESNREQFNPKLFERDNYEIVKAIENVVRSCEVDKYFTLKVLSFTVIEDYEEIYNTLRAHEESRRRKNNKLENSYDFININDTDIILVKIEWLMRHNGIERIEEDGKTYEVNNPQEVVEVLIALPRFVKKYYFKLSGNYYSTIFQIVDGSTYNNSTASQSKVDTVTMKTMFSPLRIFRCFRDMTDIATKQTFKVIEYNVNVFSNTVNALYYLLAHFGFYGLQQFLDIYCVYVTPEPIIREDYYCFNKYNLFISCPKYAFVEPMVQTFVSALYIGIFKDTTFNDVFDIRYWMRILGMAYKNASIDKGLFILDSLDGIYDKTTHDNLHLAEEDKHDIYCVIRWLLREFSELRVKENVDVRTKRIRIADYVAAIYATKLNKGKYRISDMGRRVTLKKVVQAIYTQPFYLLNNMTSSAQSNLISYRDMVNDDDASVAMKYTYKGISGLGEDGASVQPVYRYVDPSHIGILDLDASSASDPGLSGMLCPMVNIYDDNSFSNYQEPNTWREKYAPIKEQYNSGRICPVTFTKPTQFDYYKLRDQVVQEELELNKIICPVYNVDPNISYSCAMKEVEKQNNTPIKNLFSIKD